MPGLVIGLKKAGAWSRYLVLRSNCRGWGLANQTRRGRVTGHGVLMGEGAGGSELMHRCMQLVGYAWSKRGPMTKLADALAEHAGAKDLEDLIHGYTTGVFPIGADAAPIVFRVAEQGDSVVLRSHPLGRL